MHSSTARFLKKLSVTRKRVNFNLHYSTPHMSAIWSTEELERQLRVLAERTQQMKMLKLEDEAHRKRILACYEAQNLKSHAVEGFTISRCSKASIKYSRKLEREEFKLKEAIKKMKAKEVENWDNPDYSGPDQCADISRGDEMLRVDPIKSQT